MQRLLRLRYGRGMALSVAADAYTVVEASTLVPYHGNPRKGDVEAIRTSIRANGFFGALVVRKSTREILVGNHRFRAGVAEGMTAFPVNLVDVDDEQARKILLADNRTGDLGTYDQAVLDALLRDIVTDADDAVAALDGTGFSAAEVDALLAKSGGAVDPTTEWEGMPDFNQPDKSAQRQITVSFKTDEDVEAFAKLIGQNITDKTRSLWYPAAEIERYIDKRYTVGT